jgi:hypothetical protein
MLLRLAVSVIVFFCPQAGQARTFFIDKKVSKVFFPGDKGFSTEGKNNHKACVIVRFYWLLSTTA